LHSRTPWRYHGIGSTHFGPHVITLSDGWSKTMRTQNTLATGGISAQCTTPTTRSQEFKTPAKNALLKIILPAFSLLLGAAHAALAQPFCPVSDPLCQGLATQCVQTVPGTICRAQTIITDPAAPGGIRAESCSCFTDTECGGIQFIAANNSVRCLGACPVPPTGNQC